MVVTAKMMVSWDTKVCTLASH